MDRRFVIQVSASIPKKKSPIAGKSKYYAKFCIGDSSKETTTRKEEKKRVLWDDTLWLEGDEPLTLEVHTYRKHSFGKDEYVGCHKEDIGSLLERGNDAGIANVAYFLICANCLVLRAAVEVVDTDAQITLKFNVLIQKKVVVGTADDLQARDAATKATSGVQQLVVTTPAAVQIATGAVGTTTDVVNTVQSLETTWAPLLQKIKLFTTIVDGIAEIHPYTSLAWSVLSAANQVLVAQVRDDRVIRLAATMNDTFTFIDDAEPLKAVKAHMKTITLMVQQATECGYFIADYTRKKSFWIRTAKYTLSDIDTKITDYENFKELKDAFHQDVAVQTGVTVFRMMNHVKDTGASSVVSIRSAVSPGSGIAAATDLNDMPYAFGARYTQEKGCLPGTRESIINKICEILNDANDSSSRVCLLTGVAGSGKSAIAHTIARRFDQQDRLGSSYCFDRSHAANRNPGNFFSTIARDLADHNPQYKQFLWDAVKDNRALRTSTSPLEQLEEFLVKPTDGLDTIGPLVIVVDALDECGDYTTRRHLLAAVSQQISQLALGIRLLITARPEHDILDALQSSHTVTTVQLDDVDPAQTNEDLAKYIEWSLGKYPELDDQWPDKGWCKHLVNLSEHLFQWAFTACRFIEGDGYAGADPFIRWIRTWPIGQVILGQLFHTSNLGRFQEVMGITLGVKEPLSLAALTGLFGGSGDVQRILKPMGSLLAGVTNSEKPIQPLHTSFRDFLLDKNRSHAFSISITSLHHLQLGTASLKCMTQLLKFNMCNLEDSFISNSVVPNLQERIQLAIPSQLAYACQNWMKHLEQTVCTSDLMQEVSTFFKGYFPFWMEAISLLCHSNPITMISSALDSCASLQSWSKVGSQYYRSSC
ncbi:hypothetical protein F5I97DRAFT_1993105 [Phlebopus sp. FC_14]|nr:hypothetical protein F5I97DRAFT_1993105 [Phlebopus sp. FC_14]